MRRTDSNFLSRRTSAIFAAIAAASCGLASCANLDSFLFNPYKVTEYELEASVIPADRRELVRVRTADDVDLWAVLALRPEPKANITVLYSHGNTGSIDYYWKRVSALYSYGYNVMIYDYRGFGKSAGTPTEEGLYEDARAALAYLKNRPEIDGSRVVYYGVSLGGAMAIDLARRTSPAALVVESTFRSVEDLAEDGSLFLPSGFVTTHAFPSVDKIGAVKAPVLVIHGTKDDFVQTKYGRDLFEAAAQPKELVLVDGANHDNVVELRPDLYREKLTAFVARSVP